MANDLNPPQQEAVSTLSGPLLVLAGAGTGKTRVVTYRIARLIRHGTRPSRILAVTFTNKAAKEMRERLDRLVGYRSEALTVGTFHSFCAKLLRIDGHHLGLDSNYSIYDADDQATIIKQSMELADVDPKRNPPRAVLSAISKAKNQLWDSRAMTKNADQDNFFEETCARVYHHYEEILTRNNALDFDDLLMKSVQLLREFPEVRKKYQDRYQYIMVDEFQDTNIAQYQLARFLAESHQNICVVGDPDQSIYSWRSADIRNILSFQQDYPKSKTITLDQNYRSTSTILEAAKNIISINGRRIQNDLFTDNDKGHLVEVREAYDEGEEASFVIAESKRLVREDGFKPGDCAVMYRINAQSRALEEACLHQGTKYRLVGGIRFYKRREVKDLMAYLHMVHNPHDDVNVGRVINVPPRGIGAKSMQQMATWARGKDLPMFSAMQEVAAARLAPTYLNYGFDSLGLEPSEIRDAYLFMGWGNYFAKNNKGAVYRFDEYVKAGGKDPNAIRGRGFAQFRLGAYDKAVKDLSAAAAKEPKTLLPVYEVIELPGLKQSWTVVYNARSTLGWIAYRNGNSKKAVQEFSKVLKTYPALVDSNTGMGYALLALGHKGEAARHFKAALDVSPYYPDALRGMKISGG